MDLLCALVLLPILALATLVMTIVMRLLSPGPVFFCQERIGHRGNRFKIYKFRTMHVNHNQEQHADYFRNLVDSNAPMVKPDSQIQRSLIPGGRLIRSAGLDEFPQLINIIRGEMTLVGPRPCLPQEYNLYRPQQRERFHGVPGVTGLWQVSGKNRLTFDQMIELDIHYVRHSSLWLDCRIIAMTAPALLMQIKDNREKRSAKVISRQTEVPFPRRRKRTAARLR